MDYNELITRAQHAAADAPGTDEILTGMHRTMRYRRRQRQAVLSVALVLVAGMSLLLLKPDYESHITLVESVSAHIDTPVTRTPAPLVGYRNSMYNRQIYTLL